MLSAEETIVLNQQDPHQVVCKTCGATLGQYRLGEKCSAPLHVRCDGFQRVETMLKQN